MSDFEASSLAELQQALEEVKLNLKFVNEKDISVIKKFRNPPAGDFRSGAWVRQFFMPPPLHVDNGH